MITIRLRGGLGNQLFQYATARALADRLGTSVALDLRSYRRANRQREYELGPYALPVSLADAAHRPPRRDHRLRSALWRVLHPRLNLFHERQFAFDPAVLALPDETHLEGYFQSEQYFADRAALIRSELTVRHPLQPKNQDILAQIHGTLAVSLHIRRSDYVSDPHTNSSLGTIALDFYRSAATTIATRIAGSPTFFAFSDDPAWVKANLVLPFPIVVIDQIENSPPAEHLALMSACRHNIIANSSFSWWGAWLNSSPDKTVIAPRQWFRSGEVDESTVVPESWMRL